jgi:hypothetical protein
MYISEIMNDPGALMEGGMMLLTVFEIVVGVILVLVYNKWSKF